jgi:hypothetical protein
MGEACVYMFCSLMAGRENRGHKQVQLAVEGTTKIENFKVVLPYIARDMYDCGKVTGLQTTLQYKNYNPTTGGSIMHLSKKRAKKLQYPGFPHGHPLQY